MKKFLVSLLPAALLLALAVLFARIPEPLEAFRLKYFDQLMRLCPRPYQDVPVRIADIDDATLQKYGQWPWPRSLLARLVDRLKEEKVSVAAFDILFAEPDRTSPVNLLPLWASLPEASGLDKTLLSLPDHDSLLAESMKTLNTVTAFSLSTEASGGSPLSKAGFSFAGSDPRIFLPDFPGTVTTLPILEKNAAGNGIITYLAEFDGTVRSVPLVFQLRGALYPSLMIEALRLHFGAKSYVIKTSGTGVQTQFRSEPGIEQLKVAKSVIPTTRLGSLRLYDSGYVPSRSVPVWQILEGKIAPGSLEGKIVFIGTSAAGLKDIRATPLNPAAAGVEVHAQLTEQILSGIYLLRPDWAEGAEFCFFLFAGIFLILCLPRMGAAWAAFITTLCICAFYGFSFHAFKNDRWLVDPVLPSLATLIIYIASSLLHFLRTDAEKRQIRGAFSRYLAPAIVEELAKNPEKLKLGGELKNMSVLFADIQGFTSMAEKMRPEELTKFLNQFLTPMTGIILDHGGTIDKYMGDSVMAFWNAPVEDPLHSRNACLAALEMQKKLQELNQKQTPVQIGIGINTGSCCVGNLGSSQRFDYSVLGDAVNLASRLEGLTRIFGAQILIGPETHKETSGALFSLEAGRVRVKGKEEAVIVYALAGPLGLLTEARRTEWTGMHTEMLKAFRRRDWDKAMKLCTLCREHRFPDADLTFLYNFYENKIEAFRKIPPPPEWDGVLNQDIK